MQQLYTSTSSPKTEGYIAIVMDLPYQADKRFTEWQNPDIFSSLFGEKIEEGELLQKVHVWSDRKVEVLNNQEFPPALPLKHIVSGKEGGILKILVQGKEIALECAQKLHDGSHFEDSISYLNRSWKLNDIGLLAYESLDISSFKQSHAKSPEIREKEPLIVEKPKKQEALKPDAIIDQAQLMERYQRKAILGSGGTGAVFEVMDKKEVEKKALKLSILPTNPEVIKGISSILTQNHSAHLTRIDDVFKIPCNFTPPEIFPSNSENFIYPPVLGSPRLTLTGTVMELMDDDIESLYPNLPLQTRMAIQIQIASIHSVLKNQFHISVEDDKLRNIFYKKLTNEDTFNGHNLIDYDYWKYTFDGVSFYIPKMDYVIKLGDYDPWSVDTTSEPVSAVEFLNDRLKAMVQSEIENLDAAKAAALFPRPSDENAKILDMTP